MEIKQPEARLMIKHARWSKVREEALSMVQEDDLVKYTDVDILAARITQIATEALEKHCPRTKPSPYAKRWWSADLTLLRKTYKSFRNVARSVRRATGRPDATAEWEATIAKHRFHHTIRQVRK